jgi:hypothetical protein
MTASDIRKQLLKIAPSDDFESASIDLTEAWSEAGVGVESIDPILEFMEAHPDLDYGMPGALVHFVENYHKKGYEEKLMNSIKRKPTPLTVWMLNRLLNGTRKWAEREVLISTMRQAATHPKTDQETLARINEFLERLD